ncbi:hypothetical protein MSG28_010702 [Choristoneura fumiferana]|uniref:Uncharacterized protein n=1 Tax=Choristoneura fumiferana TaxID=7141 RepID=A0ACC0KNM2_CHOFU|nr:hypothetical protein MSG28_010702 [Choristoneura fumiferana]
MDQGLKEIKDDIHSIGLPLKLRQFNGRQLCHYLAMMSYPRLVCGPPASDACSNLTNTPSLASTIRSSATFESNVLPSGIQISYPEDPDRSKPSTSFPEL